MECEAAKVVAALATDRGQDLLTIGYLLSGDHDEAADIVQTVLTRLLQSGAIARADNPFAYAKRSVTNEFLDRQRRFGRRAKAFMLLHSEPTTVDSADTSVAEQDALQRAFAVLRPRERVCIVLRYYGGSDDESIAAFLGCAPATVRSLVSRALPRLRAALESAELELHPRTDEGDRR